MSSKSNELKHSDDWAVYLPALSSFYTKMLETIKNNPDSRTIDGIPDLDQLNFLDPNSDIFFYKYGLYSAGHAQLDLSKTDDVEPMVQKRDRSKTTIVGDSGGFQIAKGVLKLDWTKFYDKEGDETREKILRWLEHTSDWSMTLDVPAFAASPPLSEKTGLHSFQDTLDYSVHNLHYFMEHRKLGATKFLNVLSGSTVENSQVWYDGVKKYSDPKQVEEMGFEKERTFEGYAFAGINMRNMYAALTLMLNLIEDGLLEDKGWIHFLGTGKADWACYLTSIQKRLRKWYSKDIKISFDAASPFVATAYGQCYNHNSFLPKRWGYNMYKAVDDKNLAHSDMPMPFNSNVMNRLKVEDICVYGNEHTMLDGERRYDISEEECAKLVEAGLDAKWVPAGTNKNGKVGNTSWDSMSYLLYMAHNVNNHIVDVQESNRLVDIELATKTIDHRNWAKSKKSEAHTEISKFVPHSILYFDSFIEELLNPATPNKRELLEKSKNILETISFGSYQNTEHFDSMFATAIEDSDDPDRFADQNDDKILDLENSTDEE